MMTCCRKLRRRPIGSSVAAQVVDGDGPQLEVLSFHVAEPLQSSSGEHEASGAVTSRRAPTAIRLQSLLRRTVAS